MADRPLNKIRNCAAADTAAKQNFSGPDLSSPVGTCPARQSEIFVVPTRYALAEQAAEHPDFNPPAPTKSHPMALRHLREGYLYVWQQRGPLKRYAVAADGLLLEQPVSAPHAPVATGELAGVALTKHADARMLYSEIPLGADARERLRYPAERLKRMRHISLTDVGKTLRAPHCLPVDKATQWLAELMPKVRGKTLAHDYQQNGERYQEGLKQQGQVMHDAPTQDNIKAYIDSSEWLRERQEAAAAQPSGTRIDKAPGHWSASPWDLKRTEAWLDAVKAQSAPLYAVFAAVDDDLGVLRDIDHEQLDVEAEHETWVADNSVRQTVGSFIRSMITEDGAEIANSLNYRYREHDLKITPEQGETLLESQKQLYELLVEESRINQQRGRAYGHSQADALLADVHKREQSVLNEVRSFIPNELHNQTQDVVLEYREEKTRNLEGGFGAMKVAEYIDLEAMNQWLDEEAPSRLAQAATRQELLYADREIYLRRTENGTWFVDRRSDDELNWLDEVADACLAAQCLRSQGVSQFDSYLRSDDPGLLRLVFHAWSPTLEAAINSASRLNELTTALGQDNLDDVHAAIVKILDEDTLRSLQRLAGRLKGAWATTMARLSPAMLRSSGSFGPAMGLLLVIRLGENTRLMSAAENGAKIWQLMGQKADVLHEWTSNTARAIRFGHVGGIVNSPAIRASGGLLPLGALVVNLINAGSYASQASALEGSDKQREADTMSSYLYAGAALGAVMQNWVILGKGIDEFKFRRGRISATAPTLTLFGAIVGGISARAAYHDFKSLQIQIDNAHGSIDPWLKIRMMAAGGQVALFVAQAILGFGLTAMRIVNIITTPTAIRLFRLGNGPLNLLLLAAGIIYFVAWLFQQTPFQDFLNNCCWCHRRAKTKKAIPPQAQQDELDQLFTLLFQPRISMEIEGTSIYSLSSNIVNQRGISQITIDLPGASPDTTVIDVAMNGDEAPCFLNDPSGALGLSKDLGGAWLKTSECTWIPVDEGQGLRLRGNFGRRLKRLSLRLRYSNPLAELATSGHLPGGDRGYTYTLTAEEGLLSLGDGITTLRPSEPTPELDRAKMYRLSARDNSSYLTPKEKS